MDINKTIDFFLCNTDFYKKLAVLENIIKVVGIVVVFDADTKSALQGRHFID